MPSKKKLSKELEKLSLQFLETNKRKNLLASLSGDKTEWFRWTAGMKNIIKNLDKGEAVKFSGLALLLEQNSDSRFYQDRLNKFLIDKVEFYKYHDFSLDKKLAQAERGRKNLWISKILRLFISRSFLGIIIIILIVAFIAWFYLDRESCLEFVDGVVGPFLKAVK